MEILPQKDDFRDDELLTFLEGFCSIAFLTSTCQEADFSGVSPSESKQGSAQWWAYLFGSIMAWYVLKDKEWRLNLFNEGEFIIDGKPTKIWVWDDIWGDSNEKGAPDRLIPLVVGSFLSDYDNNRDWKALREHYLCMWSGSYTSYGKPLSEICPQDDLYWAMRIGFVDKILKQPKPTEVQSDIGRQLTMIKDTITSMSLRQVKEQHEDQTRWDNLFQQLPTTLQKIRSRIEHQLGSVVSVLPNEVFSYCVQAEQYYENGTMQAPAILSFAKAVEACLNYCFVNPLIEYVQKQEQKHLTVCFPQPRGPEKKTVGALRKLSLSEWADILDMLSNPKGKSLSDLVIRQLAKFMEEHLGGQRLPDFRPLGEPLRKIQQHRNVAAHHPSRWEDPQQDLAQVRSLVLGIGGQIPLVVLIPQLLAPQK